MTWHGPSLMCCACENGQGDEEEMGREPGGGSEREGESVFVSVHVFACLLLAVGGGRGALDGADLIVHACDLEDIAA